MEFFPICTIDFFCMEYCIVSNNYHISATNMEKFPIWYYLYSDDNMEAGNHRWVIEISHNGARDICIGKYQVRRRERPFLQAGISFAAYTNHKKLQNIIIFPINAKVLSLFCYLRIYILNIIIKSVLKS